eukprot:GHRR01037136.1.p1 GENE.GHRR01037136.1~~GHRR01037136.1.p1  ORF type:complete len:168 (+),score=22.75 GHRR01037136.1:171-674(+)
MDGDIKLQQYLLLGKTAKGRSMCELITKATAEPGLFAFGELLDLPNIQELQSGEYAAYKSLLELFCYGTWSDYQQCKANLPPLTPQHELKLKQLTIASLGSSQKVEMQPCSIACNSIQRRPLHMLPLRTFAPYSTVYCNLLVMALCWPHSATACHTAVSRCALGTEL